jgi:type II secretory pathway component GspD/PulD (secretin)
MAAQEHSGSQSDPIAQSQQRENTRNDKAARGFEGKIIKVGRKLVLREAKTKTSYQLDDQDKAKQFEGRSVNVVATMDPNTNTLHVVDIAPAGR